MEVFPLDPDSIMTYYLKLELEPYDECYDPTEPNDFRFEVNVFCVWEAMCACICEPALINVKFDLRPVWAGCFVYAVWTCVKCVFTLL